MESSNNDVLTLIMVSLQHSPRACWDLALIDYVISLDLQNFVRDKIVFRFARGQYRKLRAVGGIRHDGRQECTEPEYRTPRPVRDSYARTAYLRRGKFCSFLTCFSVLSDDSCCERVGVSIVAKDAGSGADLGQAATDSTGLLDSEVKGQKLLGLVVFAEVLASLLVHHGQYPCDRLADGVAEWILDLDAPLRLDIATHILVSFEADPPAIF